MSQLVENFTREVAKYCEHVPVHNFDYSINISLKHKYLFVETPKAGCSTIKSILQKMELDRPDFVRNEARDLHYREFSPLLRPAQVGSFEQFVGRPDIFKFCFTRNPYSRLLSAYLEKICQNKPPKQNILQHLGYDPNDIQRNISFAEFVRGVCSQAPIQMNPHWRIQFYQTFRAHIDYDFIGSVENFSHDLPQALARIRPDFNDFVADEKRHATGSNQKLAEHFTAELVDAVRKTFALDFEHFGHQADFDRYLSQPQ